MGAARKTAWSTLSAKETKARLKTHPLPAPFPRLVAHALRRDEAVLWCDGPWARPKKMPIDPAKVALIVIDGPLATKKGLSLRYEDILGSGFVPRDDQSFLFLGEVEAHDIFAVPEVLALFPRGLAVERIASLESPDGGIFIADHFHAPLVVSGVSDSGASIAKGTELRIGAYARYLSGVPKREAKSFDTLEELLPFLADGEDDTWAILEELKNKKFPKAFVVPTLPRPTRTGAKKKQRRARR
jgi:hypothetical protein